jgi:SAM-dependent methyltransferase
MGIETQVRRGLLICPRTKAPLHLSTDGQWLEAEGVRYRLLGGTVPILLADEAWAERYAGESVQMQQEYRPGRLKKTIRAMIAAKDYRNPAATKAFGRIFDGLPPDAVCLSPGGGPSRENPMLTTVNIGPFPNVDVVADAHALPYANGSVDAIYSEAVFEHLYDPVTAAQEAFRVLKPGRLAFVCTPFLQPYHGYPHHYQNYTITGQARLFEKAGFEVLETGTSVGPVYAITTQVALFLRTYPPRWIGLPMRAAWEVFSAIVRPLDKWIAPRSDAHLLASTTYVLLRKPAQTGLPQSPS